MRSSWQIDLKWMLGMAAVIVIVAAGVMFSLMRITQRDTAVPIASALAAAGINDRVSDQEYAQVQQVAASNPSATVSVSPLSLSITGADIAGRSKEDTAGVIGSRLGSVLYDNGKGTAEKLIVTPPAESGKDAISLGPVGALTASNHDLFTKIFLGLVLAAAVLLTGVAILSRGFGRLGSPAFIMALGSAPLALLWFAADKLVGPGDSGEGTFTHNAREAFLGAAGDLKTAFIAIAAGAGVLVVVSVVAGVIGMVAGNAADSVKETVAVVPTSTPQPAPAPAPVPTAVQANPYRASGIPQVEARPARVSNPESPANQQVA